MAVDGVQETWGKGTKFLRILPPCSFSVCCYIPLFMYPQSVIYSFHYLKRRILTTVYHEKGNNQENILSHERFPNYAMANYSQKLQNSKSCTLFFHKMITVPNMLAFFFFFLVVTRGWRSSSCGWYLYKNKYISSISSRPKNISTWTREKLLGNFSCGKEHFWKWTFRNVLTVMWFFSVKTDVRYDISKNKQTKTQLF